MVQGWWWLITRQGWGEKNDKNWRRRTRFSHSVITARNDLVESGRLNCGTGDWMMSRRW